MLYKHYKKKFIKTIEFTEYELNANAQPILINE